MKKYPTLQNLEIIAIGVTVILKFILMDWLKLRGVYITGVSLFWIWYVFYRVQTIPNILYKWGFKTSGFRQSFLFLLPFILITVFICILYADISKTLSFSWHIIPIFLLYPIWGVIQQFLMLGIIAQNLATLFNTTTHRYVIIIIISVLFSLIHYPSFFLMILTFCLEILFIVVYNKWRNLWAIGIAHGWVATFLLFYVLERDLWLELFFSH